MITVAALSPSLDITYLVDSLELGAIHRPTEVHRVAGGKSFNLARAATTAGARVATVAVLGGSTGDFLASELSAAGIQVDAVDSPSETRTCVSIAASDRGDLTEIYPYAPPIPTDVWQRFRTTLGEDLDGRAGWLAINGSAPQGLPDGAFGELTAAASALGVRVAIDTHGPALSGALEASPQLVKINRYEAAALLGQDPDSADLSAMIIAIADRTQGSVIITDGRAGAVGTDGSKIIRAELPADIDGHYPVGSGDSFLGGWLAAVDEGADAGDALRLASGCGAANALLPGPGNLERATAEEIARRTILRPL
ncbi:1-phosphofructokinase family hexose kinase [Microlunatus soli]|uniref:Tagatose 6-phosphate kinase n=1 Tax=Microlunatus soli TaxID=630515 RepID=A0A1H1NSL3_9ACTN|nr:PfkB family carbohydrate kinase [Microlunatus soli]SDS01369.1 tagatose 6-phosphate kinase [Microlunatus soli]